MSARTIRLLHVEDDEIQRRMLRAQLATLPDYAFAITCVASEDAAVEAFRGGYDFVSRLDRLERDARAARLTFAQTLRLFENACDKLDNGHPGLAKRLLRPVMLEIVLRLFEEAPARG